MIKVLTYNICHCVDFSMAKSPQWKFEYNKIDVIKTAKTIKKIKADIVGLNEIYCSEEPPFYNQPKTIAGHAGYKYNCFGKACDIEGFGAYGNAFLSKYKIKEFSNNVVSVPLTNKTQNAEDRSFIRAVIDVGVLVTVFVAHFGLSKTERENIVSAILEKAKGDKNPKILIGDFNAEPDSEELQPLYGEFTNVAKYMKNTQKSFSTYAPNSLIDYIMVTKEFKIVKYKVIPVNTSDHFPCYAKLKLKREGKK